MVRSASPAMQYREVISVGIPKVPAPGGGERERDRNKDGSWRKKRNDAGKKRGSGK